MKNHVILIISACLFAGCQLRLPDAGVFDRSTPALPCSLQQDTTTILIRDFFPMLEKIDSLSSVSVGIDGSRFSGKDTIQLILKKETPLLSILEVWSEGVKGAILLKNGSPQAPHSHRTEATAPLLATFAAAKSNRMTVKIEGAPANYFIFWQNTLLDARFIDYKGAGRFDLLIPENSINMERSWLRMYTYNKKGIGNDLLIPLSYGKPVKDPAGLTRNDKHAQIMYSLMVDRFYNGNPANDKKLNSPDVHPKVDYWGGDLAGITEKIKEGFFDTLGVNTIWISPISQNPYDAWGLNPDPKTKFSGYHGYWPIYITKVDERYGTEQELREMLSAAHDDHKNVILDYVAHHMHINSPTLRAHPDWTTPSVTPDGRPNFELWDEFRLTTWFDKHIPSLDLGREEVSRPLVDSALYWLRNYAFDGFRHDATKHVPELFWRMLSRQIGKEFPNRTVYQIGETYGAPELINLYVRNGMMDGQFDFNVYDTFIWTLLESEGSFENVSRVLGESLRTYGYHNLMGYITGNHDRPRFISLAGGAVDPHEDTKKAGWKREIGVGDPSAYRKLSLLEAFIFTIPGVPCIYYGDEYGQPGANDPDNRRWMKFNHYTPLEEEVLQKVKQLTRFRSGSMPLIYGDFFPILAEKDILVYIRVYMGEWVLMGINKSEQPVERSVDLPFGLNGHKPLLLRMPPLDYTLLSGID